MTITTRQQIVATPHGFLPVQYIRVNERRFLPGFWSENV